MMWDRVRDADEPLREVSIAKGEGEKNERL
jgi:hypothetical protein